MGRRLRAAGVLTDDWTAAFEAVDRALFLPDVMWAHDMDTRRNQAVDRSADPEGWLRVADSDVPIVTQWDDGTHEGPDPGRVPTSSCSMPSVVFRMLRDLDVADGDRVLEVGTGTGYNAALLAYRLGDGNVTSVEVDPTVTATARKALAEAGRHPRVICGDGLRGWPGGAPYDRIVATCGTRSVPAAWPAQTRPGGIVLAPWGTDFTNQDALARLVAAGDGSASGRFTGGVEFMKARSQRLVWPRFEEYLPDGFPAEATVTKTDLSPFSMVPGGPFTAAPFAVGLAVPDCAHTVQRGDGEALVWFISLTDRSWAAVRRPAEGDEGTVYQSGARRMWDEVVAAWRWWDAAGRPGVERFGLTVRADGTHEVWLEADGRRVPVGGG
ncbi:Protein-L-isoaspartate(D-aspartate) O-methyltransferase (plasmid) [Streptantibioticus cattleyicolor NRRL 8057 = DSM 46488]|nr:Protein-L-isoaspartate(D-aspartate) O-methyltransferase [Streptantibioticus cattleyicolor NRRL 8057 = DSM 46488]